MTAAGGWDWPIWFAVIYAVILAGVGLSIFLLHDRKYEELDHVIDYSYSTRVFGTVVLYYRGFIWLMTLAMIVFVISLFCLQRFSGLVLFAEGQSTIVSMLFFAVDLIARGAFFDWMEHFNWSITPITMNREYFWFVLYCFVFRMFYALTLLRILISFAWIWRKLSKMRKEMQEADQHYG